jgi:hypothetical protein
VEHGRLDLGTGGGTSESQAITTVDLTESFVIGSIETDAYWTHYSGHWAVDFETDSLVRMRRNNTTDGGDTAMRYQIVSDPDLTVQYGEFTHTTAGDTDTLTTVNADVAVPICDGLTGTPSSPGADNTAGHADEHAHKMWLDDETTIEVAATNASTGRLVTWQVIEFDSDAPPATRRVMVIS